MTKIHVTTTVNGETAEFLTDPLSIAPAGDVTLRVVAGTPNSVGTYRLDLGPVRREVGHGELRAVGSQASGSPWAVALERPEAGRRGVHGVIELEDLAVATSGDYRRYLEVGGARLAHTMDPRRWAPVNNGVASVTVLARTCMQADAWATALLVAGPGEGLTMAQRMGMDVLFLLRRATGLIEVGLGRLGRA